MRYLAFFVCFIALYTGTVAVYCPYPHEKDKTLVLAHVLFRHGNRTANNKAELYPTDPYYNKTYYPTGLGQLTNAGKVKEYNLGRLLRRRYKHFLGDVVYPQLVDARTTDYNRTKASLLYLLAGLFPPKKPQVWSWFLDWQAIPYNYQPVDSDPLLMGINCPNYLKLYDENRYSSKQQQVFAEYKKDFTYISKYSGLNVTSFNEIYNVYFGLSTEEEYGLTLPSFWNKVWPTKVIYYCIREYYVSVATTALKQMAAGYLIEKIVMDTQAKIQEDPSDKFPKKLYLYSAHENNIAQLMVTLDIFDDEIPNYGSYISFEVHLVDGTYGIKIFYENYYDTRGPRLLKLPACDEFCPLDTFITLYKQYFPSPNLCYET